MELEGDWWIRNAKDDVVIKKAVRLGLASQFCRAVEDLWVNGRNAGRSWSHLAAALGMHPGELSRKRNAKGVFQIEELLGTAMIFGCDVSAFIPDSRTWLEIATRFLVGPVGRYNPREPLDASRQVVAELQRECRAFVEYGIAWIDVRDDDWEDFRDPTHKQPPVAPFRDDRAARRAMEALGEWPKNTRQGDEATLIDAFMKRIDATAATIVKTAQRASLAKNS